MQWIAISSSDIVERLLEPDLTINRKIEISRQMLHRQHSTGYGCLRLLQSCYVHLQGDQLSTCKACGPRDV